MDEISEAQKNTDYRDLDLSELALDKAVQLLKALGHRHRLRIVGCLISQERHVAEMAELLKINPSIVSQQLRILRLNQLVKRRFENGRANYRIQDSCVRSILEALLCPKK